MSEPQDRYVPGDRRLPPHLDPRGAGRSRVAEPGPSGLPPHLDPRGRGSEPVRPEVLPPRHPRRRRVARVLSWTALVLSVVVFAVAALGYVLYRRYDGNISRIPGLGIALPGLHKPAAAPKGARNILLVGSDTRDTTGDEFQGVGVPKTVGQRSDTVILAHLYGGSDHAQLVSLPRDSWVSIPEYTDPKTARRTAEHSAKLNAAIAEGGPALLIATVEKLTDIRVDNYVQIDFAGFQNMVQKLGGVEICLTHDAKEPKSGIDLKAGRQVVDGQQALAFVRQRYELPNGDLDRIRRQQAFIASITRKVLSSGTLLDPFKLNGFLGAATSSVSVDDSLSGGGLAKLALRLRSFNAGGVTFSTLPVGSFGTREGQSVVLLDQQKTADVFTALRADEEPGAAPAPTDAPLTVAPKAVRVQVQNAAGTAGLGRTAAQDLSRAGFVVVGAPGNSGSGQEETVVRYGPAGAEAARTLAAAVRGGARLQQDAALTGTVVLDVGSGWRGLVPVSAGGGAPAPAPSAAPVSAAQAGCVA